MSDRGQGVPLVVLAGLSPDAGVGRGPMRRTHEQVTRALGQPNDALAADAVVRRAQPSMAAPLCQRNS